MLHIYLDNMCLISMIDSVYCQRVSISSRSVASSCSSCLTHWARTHYCRRHGKKIFESHLLPSSLSNRIPWARTLFSGISSMLPSTMSHLTAAWSPSPTFKSASWWRLSGTGVGAFRASWSAALSTSLGDPSLSANNQLSSMLSKWDSLSLPL